MNTKTDTKKPAARNRLNGQYAFDGKFERLCVCGHTLGSHLAGGHDCIQHECPGGTDEICACVKFKLARR